MADWKKRYETVMRRRENEDEKAAEYIMAGLDSLLTLGVSGGLGYMHGRKGGVVAVAGMPIDAILFTLGTFGGWAAMLTGHAGVGRPILAAANGAGSPFVYAWTSKLGQDWRKQQKNPDGTPMYLGRQYTTEEAQKLDLVARPPVLAGRDNMQQIAGAAFTRSAMPRPRGTLDPVY